MCNLNIKEVNTKYGIIYSRDAMIISDYSVNLFPLSLTVTASLLLSGCIPSPSNNDEVSITFKFTNIEFLSVYMIDDFPYEKNKKSSFDEVEGDYKRKRNRIFLSTYDHVFDVTGNCEVVYG